MNESISVEQKLRVELTREEANALVNSEGAGPIYAEENRARDKLRQALASPNQNDDLIYTENCVCGAFFRDPYPRYHAKGCTGPQRLTWKEQARHYAEAAIARRNEHKRSNND